MGVRVEYLLRPGPCAHVGVPFSYGTGVYIRAKQRCEVDESLQSLLGFACGRYRMKQCTLIEIWQKDVPVAES